MAKNGGQFVVKHKINEQFFMSMSAALAWVLGILAADGHITKTETRVSLSQSNEHGLRLLKEVIALISYDGPIYATHTRLGGTAYSFQFTSSQVCKQLAMYGIINGKTGTFTFPDLPQEYAKDFIRGYIDGDGCIGVYKINGYEVLSISMVGTPAFIDKASTICPVPGNISNNKTVMDLRWWGEKATAIGNWLYANKELPKTKKSLIFFKYMLYIENSPPKWLLNKRRRETIKKLADTGATPVEIIKTTGENFKYVYAVLSKFNKHA